MRGAGPGDVQWVWVCCSLKFGETRVVWGGGRRSERCPPSPAPLHHHHHHHFPSLPSSFSSDSTSHGSPECGEDCGQRAHLTHRTPPTVTQQPSPCQPSHCTHITSSHCHTYHTLPLSHTSHPPTVTYITPSHCHIHHTLPLSHTSHPPTVTLTQEVGHYLYRSHLETDVVGLHLQSLVVKGQGSTYDP